jgi:glycosyltransferase involved in cell wall biosynthesis
MPFFSICIPVYKNIQFLKRLLDSIVSQTFSDYEIIITDDSPDNSVVDFLRGNYKLENLKYFKNQVALGTPENWNEGIRQATGKWIKLMHDDDWFVSNEALQLFYNATIASRSTFFFCAYQNVYLDQNKNELVHLPSARWKRVTKYFPALYARNVIGPPSVVLVKNGSGILYDSRMKWLVDIDFYIRVLHNTTAHHIPELLVSVGVGKEQVTQYTHNRPEVEIPEGLLLQSKLGPLSFKNILYYDAWWRLIRNLGIRDASSFRQYASNEAIPSQIDDIISLQKFIPLSLLKIGPISKIFMSISWVKNLVSK